MSSSTAGRKETERTKLTQEKCQTLLTQMLRDEDNKYCVDCDAKGPRWASWNLGVFLCIRCAGIHRNLGVHISRVKSVNLDTWTPEQVISLQQMGNSRARAVYEAQLPDGFRRPQTDTALESFIRAKYEHKKYLAREWVPPSPPKVDWAKEIDEELERQKRKKKAAQVNSALGGIGSVMGGGDKKHSANTSSAANAKSSPLPAPLPKPKPHQAGSSPKTTSQRVSTNSNGGESDLLGLSSPTKPMSSTVGAVGLGAQDLNNDSFSSFLSATTTATAIPNSTTANGKGDATKPSAVNPLQNSLAQEEQDFFNQGSLAGGTEKDKSGKLSKDSILALYGTQTAHNPTQMNFGGFTGMAPGFMPAQQQPQQQHQFMTPPNSVSMYNSPVMTAPNAFSAPSMNMGNATVGGFGAQFPPSSGIGGYAGLNAPGQGGPPAGSVNLMQTNQSLLSGMSLFGTSTVAAPMTGMPQQQHPAGIANMGMGMSMGIGPAVNAMQQQSTLTSLGGMHSLPTGAYQTQTNPVNAAATANLNQQFGNLNIGNVWQ